MKKVLYFLLGGAAFVVLAVGILLGVMLLDERKQNSPKAAKNRIASVTEIELPETAEMVYLDYNQPWGPDRFNQYAVFAFEDEPTEWLAEYSFSREKEEEFERDFTSDLPKRLKNSLKAEYCPDFERPYYWLRATDVTTVNVPVYFIYQLEERNVIVYIPSI